MSLSSAILLDIEGTTTSISFVKDILFPYARQNVEQYLRNHWQEEKDATVSELRKQAEEDKTNGVEGVKKILPDADDDGGGSVPEQVLQSVLANIYWQMDIDRKTTGLKSLQGKIWKSGYDNGELKGHVYEDVPPAFQRWTAAGKKVCIYSSGSVQAQILLFGHSVAGDLCQFLSNYFDTTTGQKNQTESYEAISKKIGLSPSDILFLTDIPAEGYAAKAAGFQVKILIRPGNKPLSEKETQDFATIHNFNDLF